MTSFNLATDLPDQPVNKTIDRPIDSSLGLAFNTSEVSNNVLSTACDWSKYGPVALATLVGIEGNAPYPIGAQMLIGGEGPFKGLFEGQITGGCAERAIADHALASINAAHNSVHRYGLNSPYFDIQLPCGSGIDVHFDVGISHDEFLRMQADLKKRKAVEYRITLERAEFVKIYTPQPQLIVAGQGPILAELARWGYVGGFDSLVLAQNSETQTLCDRYQLKSMLMSAVDVSDLPDDAFTGLVSLFHEHELEVPLFESALRRNYFYFGALGSRRTHAARLESLLNAGVSEASLSQIHGPVGVDIMATTPNQIAVAIMAQAIDKLNTMLASRFACNCVVPQTNASTTLV